MAVYENRPFTERWLLINLDFRDIAYSHLWARGIIEAAGRRGRAIDMVTVNPFAGRDLASELGVPRAVVEATGCKTVHYVDQPDEDKMRAAVGVLLDRWCYGRMFLNCDAPLFVHLMLERYRELANTEWRVYDRHLHIGFEQYENDKKLRDRIAAADMHLYMIEEISKAPPPVIEFENALIPEEPSQAGMLGRMGLVAHRIHYQKWPVDDDFFAPKPEMSPKDRFVLFTGGDSGRDYQTLFDAIADLPVELRLCANNYPKPVPPNCTLLPRLRLHEFRDEVARSSAVVVPLSGTPLVSGITVIAMAKMMGKPVISTDNWATRLHIPSQGDGGYLTQQGNAALLRLMIKGLMESPIEQDRLRREGHLQAKKALGMRVFAERML